MSLLNNDTQVSVFVEGLDHPEGIAWGLDGYAYAGGEAGQVYRIDVERQEVVQFADTGGFVLGMALDADHNIYACDAGNKAIMKITKAARSQPTRPAPMTSRSAYRTTPLSMPTATCTCATRATGMKTTASSTASDREARRRYGTDDRRSFPNGLCMGPDGDEIYVAMSVNPPRVDRITIEADGSPGLHETVAEFPKTVPDGVAFDTDRNLYVSMYRPDVIYRRTPDGQIDILAEDFEGTLIAAPTNIAFCGRDRDMLLGANIGRWHITQYDVGATGLPLHYPALG